ncbi:MAG: DUF1059 domain-containing protein [Promethearchaeota archaeon]
MPKFACSDIGMKCGFKVEAGTEDELMNHIGNHAKWAHNLDPIPTRKQYKNNFFSLFYVELHLKLKIEKF